MSFESRVCRSITIFVHCFFHSLILSLYGNNVTQILMGYSFMDSNTIISIIQGVGFPIVMCGAMAWYVKYMYDNFMEQIKGQNERHEREMQSTNEALNNNTAALTSVEKTLAILLATDKND